ncbi:MAG TPA: hypothetical protein VJN19_04825, partial [Propionibacteriaceae bacterium]|nr:hypothetical protein [Propionibacteriaceae bacterium]
HTFVARSEQPLIGGLGMGLALRHFGVVFVGSHSEPLLASHKHPSRVKLASAMRTLVQAWTDPQALGDGGCRLASIDRVDHFGLVVDVTRTTRRDSELAPVREWVDDGFFRLNSAP